MLPPMLGQHREQVILPEPGRTVNYDLNYDRRNKRFNPVAIITNLASDYALALADNLDKLARIQFENDQPVNSNWIRWKNDPDIQWRVQKGLDFNKYFIRAFNEQGEFEELSSKIDAGKQAGELTWQVDGYMPGTLTTKFEIGKYQPSGIPYPSIKGSSFENYPLTAFGKLNHMLYGQPSMAANSQRVFNILASEAKWLVQIVKGSLIGGSRSIGDFKATKTPKVDGSVCKLERTGKESESLEVELDAFGKILAIRRESQRKGAKYSLAILPRGNFRGGVALEDDAVLVSVDQKAYQDRLKKQERWKQRDAERQALAGLAPSTTQQSEIDYQSIYKDEDTRVFHVGYNKQELSGRDKHKEALFRDSNLEKILPGTGLIHRPLESSAEFKFSPSNEHEDLRDFYEYTGIPPGSTSCAFVDSVRNTKVTDYPEAKETDLSTFGEAKYRTRVLKRAGRPSLADRKELKKYLQGIGVDIVRDNVDKAIYRWGIRKSKDSLAQEGIVYRESKRGKDKIYLVDISGKNQWSMVDINHIYGNQLNKTQLLYYPNQDFLKEIFPRPDGVNENSSYTAKPASKDDLRKVFKAMDFDVADDVETERFIQSIKGSHKVEDRPVLERLSSLADKNPRFYTHSVILKLAKRLLADDGYSEIVEVKSNDKKDTKTYLRYKKGGQGYLALVGETKPLKARRNNTKVLAESLGLKPRYIVLENFDLKSRTADLCQQDIEAEYSAHQVIEQTVDNLEYAN